MPYKYCLFCASELRYDGRNLRCTAVGCDAAYTENDGRFGRDASAGQAAMLISVMKDIRFILYQMGKEQLAAAKHDLRLRLEGESAPARAAAAAEDEKEGQSADELGGQDGPQEAPSTDEVSGTVDTLESPSPQNAGDKSDDGTQGRKSLYRNRRKRNTSSRSSA